MKPDLDRELKILSEIASGAHVTQRSLAKKLGIALGFANLLIRRLAKKGYIKIVNLQRNRVRYLLTPEGIAEKARLTYEYLEYSLHFYYRIRTFLARALGALDPAASQRLLLYGTGEIAEIAYLVIQQQGFTITGVIDGSAPTATFLRHPVHPLSHLELDAVECIIVASLTDREAARKALVDFGIAPEKIITIPDLPALLERVDEAGEARATAHRPDRALVEEPAPVMAGSDVGSGPEAEGSEQLPRALPAPAIIRSGPGNPEPRADSKTLE